MPLVARTEPAVGDERRTTVEDGTSERSGGALTIGHGPSLTPSRAQECPPSPGSVKNKVHRLVEVLGSEEAAVRAIKSAFDATEIDAAEVA